MKRIFLIYCILGSIFIFSSSLFAQKTAFYENPGLTYRKAVELFDQQSYAPAMEIFDKLITENILESELEKENAAYYSTVCSVELGNKDALKRVEGFSVNYPESKWLAALSFDMGKIYFNKKQYSQALESFSKVSQKNLSKSQRSELNYMKGVCFLRKSRFDQALSTFDRVDSKSSFSPNAKYYKSHIYYQKGEYDKALSGFKDLENNRSFRKYIPNYLINIYYQQGNYREVIDQGSLYMNKADRKTKADIARLIANSYFELGDYEKAYEYFNIFENGARRKIDPQEHYRIGYTKLLLDKYDAAIINFQESTSDESLIQNAWFHLGYCYLNTSQYRFAQNAFLKAYKSNTNQDLSTTALFNFVKISIEHGADAYNNPLKMLEEFISANQNNPRINEAYDLVANLYLSSKNYNQALLSIEKNGTPNSNLQKVYQQLAYSQGVEYYNRRAYTDARTYFGKALKYRKDTKITALAYYWLGDTYYAMQKYPQARENYQNFRETTGASQMAEFNRALYNIAYTYFNQKQYSKSTKRFSSFLRTNNRDEALKTDAMLRLADSYFISKKYDNALSWYNKVLANNTNDLDYATYQKAFCYGAKGDFNGKIRTLQDLTSKFTRSQYYDDALYEIATTYNIINDQRHAISNFERLIREKPKSKLSKEALVKIGFLYYNNNQYEQAINSLKQVVNKYPASLEAKEALKTLENVYMDMGKVDEYFAYAKGLDFVQVSTSMEDSLTFTTGENYYMSGDCNNAVKQLVKYTDKFPKGGFVLKAYNYLTLCLEKQNDTIAALAYYEKIASFPQNNYSEKAYLKLARYNYDQKNYAVSADNYTKIIDLTDDESIRLEAIDGVMRTSYFDKDYKKAMEMSALLLQNPKLSQDQSVKAHYIKAKSLFELHKREDAIREFMITDKLSKDELGAESKYYVALLLYKSNKLDESENAVYELSDQYSSYGYWVAKAYILLADIYYARDNIFQAEETLKSIIENYPGRDLKEEAQGKLDRLAPQPEKGDDNESKSGIN